MAASYLSILSHRFNLVVKDQRNKEWMDETNGHGDKVIGMEKNTVVKIDCTFE